MATSGGCRCLSELEIELFPNARGTTASAPDLNNLRWTGSRVRAVQVRFAFALHLLRIHPSVLMHDADAFFRPGGLELLLTFLASTNAHTQRDFVIQDNVARNEVYDDLNWGFVWMASNARSIDFLRCALRSWDHDSFSPARGGGSFFRRSQPRLNHLLEVNVEEASSRSNRVELCTLPIGTAESVFHHLTGFRNARRKVLCATIMGYLPLQPLPARVAEVTEWCEAVAPVPLCKRLECAKSKEQSEARMMQRFGPAWRTQINGWFDNGTAAQGAWGIPAKYGLPSHSAPLSTPPQAASSRIAGWLRSRRGKL